jgi:Domain of unknown function (DUF4148)
MKTKIFAALLISTAVVASAPAFAGNEHVGDDVSSWSGASTKTRAQVREELVQAEQQPGFAQMNSNVYYPGTVQQAGASQTRAEVRQALADAPKQVVAGVNENTMYPTSADAATSYTAPAVALTQGNGQAAVSNQ